MAAVDRLRAVLPYTESSEVLMRVNTDLAIDLLEDLGDGVNYDKLRAVTPRMKSPVGSITFSSVLAKSIIAELDAPVEAPDPDPGDGGDPDPGDGGGDEPGGDE